MTDGGSEITKALAGPPVRLMRTAFVTVLFLMLAGLRLAAAEQADEDSSPVERVSFGGDIKRAVQDTGALLSAPGQWHSRDWRSAAVFAVTLGGFFAADNRISDEVETHRTERTDRFAARTQVLGHAGAVALSGALLGVGLIRRNQALRDTGRDALEASLITGVQVELIKTIAGRERPSESGGSTRFMLFSSSDSFPSGHTAEAFTVAAVIAEHSNGWFVPTVAYSIATIVAIDRVAQNDHFASDVLAGAVIGGVTGKFLVRRHRRDRQSKFASLAEPRFTLGIAPIRGGASLTITYLK